MTQQQSQSSKTPNGEPLKVLFGVLTTYERHGWPHPTILQFFCDLPMRTGYAFRVIPIHNFLPAASGRNLFCKQAKDSDSDWICMIDNDMQLPENLLDAVKNAPKDADIVCPTFYMWNQSELKLTLCWGMDTVPMGGLTKLQPGYHELSKCGTGVIFIRPHVFKAMEYPYFRYVHDKDGNQTGTEDIQFCLAARAKGFKIYGTTLVRVGHFHSVELGSLWDWKEQTEKTVDNHVSASVDFGHQDSGRSPDAAPNGVPASA